MGLFNRKPSTAHDPANSTSNPRSPTTKSPAGSVSFSSLPAGPETILPPPPDPTLDAPAYLRSIHAVRQRARYVVVNCKRNQMQHFDVDLSKWKEVVGYVTSIIKRDFAPDFSQIPAHGRWQHFEAGGRPRVDQLLASWPLAIDSQERCRRLIDLFLVSVLLDAGAGTRWQYKSKESGKIYRRSEGLAVASIEMFKAGYFSNNALEPCQVDTVGLRRLTVQKLANGLQVSDSNPIQGLEGRASLLIKLGEALKNTHLFGAEGRPGHMIDYLLAHPSTQAASVPVITIPTLWSVLINGLAIIWPSSRVQVNGVSVGDAWPCKGMPASPPGQPWENIAPFHKVTQSLCYSLMTPMTKLLHVKFAGTELLTGLPEYRNGGLFVDTGLLTLKSHEMERGLKNFRDNGALKGQNSMEVVPLFDVSDSVVVEWRAATVGLLDDLLGDVNRSLGLQGQNKLSLAQMLEAGSWKAGRELAEVSRPNTKEPPILIISDGTVF